MAFPPKEYGGLVWVRSGGRRQPAVRPGPSWSLCAGGTSGPLVRAGSVSFAACLRDGAVLTMPGCGLSEMPAEILCVISTTPPNAAPQLSTFTHW
jgi:hypothetical protein